MFSLGPRQQPWAIFTPLGERIVGENDVVSKGGNNSDDVASLSSNTHILQTLASSGMVLVFQGGNWRWPGVREGFQRQIELSPTLDFTDDYSTEKLNITIETLSMTPLVVSIKGFLSEEECDHYFMCCMLNQYHCLIILTPRQYGLIRFGVGW